MKRWKRIGIISLGTLALVLLTLFILPATAMEEESSASDGIVPEATLIASGNVTDTVTWKITEDDVGEQTLTIGGTGNMKDYTGESEQPWQEWKKTIFTLIVEDGVTRIGNYSFSGMYFKNVTIGEGVEAIGAHSFAYGYNLEHVTIPGNVKSVEANAFVFHRALYSVTLEEGVEEIGHSAFGAQTAKGSNFHIPASVTSIADLACWPVSSYTVEEANQYYSAQDGVLYNKDGTALVDYPKYRAVAEYRIPDTVCEIVKGALQRIATTKRIYIPSSVQILPESYMMQWSAIEEVYIEDGVPVSGHGTFYACSKLTSVRLPENMPIKQIFSMVHYGCNALESLKIPNGVQNIERIGWPLKALQEIVYDAENAVIFDRQMVDEDITYHLTIGENVDSLPSEFTWISAQAEELEFAGSNQLYVEKGAFSQKEEPLKSLEGTVYVDGQGVLYRYDSESKTAEVVYCQNGYKEICIPAQIEPEEGLYCNVVSIGKDAFGNADGLESLIFEKPEQITEIAAYGFANCETLMEVNGFTLLEEVIAGFTAEGIRIGYGAFQNTGLVEGDNDEAGEATVDYVQSLEVSGGDTSNLTVTVKSEADTLEWNQNQENTGTYSLLTGDTMTILAAAGNREGQEDFRYRIYFQWSGHDCSLSMKAGQTYEFGEHTVSCVATEDPNSFYLEFVPMVGKTLSFPVTVVYPSPSSAGGSLKLWAMSLNETEAEEQEGELIRPDNGAVQVEWSTVRDSFQLTKNSYGSSAITLKGTEAGDIIPGSNLEWKIILQRENETSSAYGKDYVRSVNYEDILSLPEGLYWKEEVKDAIQEGRLYRSGNNWYLGEQKIFYLALSGGQLNLSAVRLKWDEEKETGVLTCTVSNMSKDAEMNTNTLSYTVYADALYTDLSEFSETEDNTVYNQAVASIKYAHSGKVNLTASASKTLNVGSGSLKLTNTTVVKPVYFGEKIDYEIQVENPGALPYQADTEECWILKDVLSPYAYIEPEGMEKMFEADESKTMGIIITGAELEEWEEQQGLYEGRIFWKNGSNSGENLMETAVDQLMIGWNNTGTGIQVKVGDQIYEEASIAAALQKAGFAPGRWTQYTITWNLNEADSLFQLNAGEIRRFQVYARAKDTFQMLSEDWQTSYPTDASLALTNAASIVTATGQQKAIRSVGDSVKRESYIAKYGMVNNKVLPDSFNVEDGEVITYSLQFTHYGKGKYENLPVVDEMYGAQVLLADEDKNPQLAGLGLEIYEENGQRYFILAEGTYSDVNIGGVYNSEDYIAASITVENMMEEQEIEVGAEHYTYKGLRTRITWNCDSLPSGSYRMYFNYKALVSQEVSGDNVYTVGNMVWMNDKINSRTYASLWGGGTIIDFYKDIVEEKGDTWQEDRLDEDGYSLLSAGQQVTYRLTLRNKGNGTYIVNGNDIADQLPVNGGVFDWTADSNVSVMFESTHESTQMLHMNRWRIDDIWGEQQKPGQQYLLWDEETQIIFTEADSCVYIYVTLTYPEDGEEDSLWSSYSDAIDGDMLVNTFYAYQFPVNVTHHLREQGQVLLQKGVYGTSYEVDGTFVETQSRINYNNKDSRDRQVIYYILLYNGGTKYWYLDDIYDCLPEGFTFDRLLNDADLNKAWNGSSIVTLAEFDQNDLVEASQNLAIPEDITYRSALIRKQETEEGILRFQINEGEGDMSVSYDKERGQCYLKQQEAIVFAYICDVGMTEETEPVALNTAFMHYTDYPKTGLDIVDGNGITFSGAMNEKHSDQNDGNTITVTGADIKQEYNIIENSVDDQWILSDVSISRGQIIPGITKYTESYESVGSTQPTEYTNAAGPFDQINWRVRLHNSGTLAITDYTFQDILPYPYVFCGTVSYRICDYLGNEMMSCDLLTFSNRQEDSLVVTNNNSNTTISLNGEDCSIYFSTNRTGTLSMDKTEDGREVLTIHFSDYSVSIPEGGYIDLYLSANNPANQYKNTVYTNQAVLTPNVQEFRTAAQGSLVRDEDGKPEAVKNSAPVTVSFGYATGSEKAVEETDAVNNAAYSTNPMDNYILLSSEESSFTYHLTVSNDTEKAMEKLVFIDNLPDQGDVSPFNIEVSRGSDFKVGLAEEPNVKVVVTKADGTIRELQEQEYSVEYSEKTEFTEEDWTGSSVWNGDKEQARSIRVLIRDDGGELIPEKAKVTVSFDCTIQEETEPGEIAWNSFGYHYKLKDLNQELEAMPLVVGVKRPEVPILEKRLVDGNGNPYEAERDTGFSFVIYEGEALKDSFEHMEDMIQYLEEHNTAYLIQEIKVEEGTSQSETILLKEFDWKNDTVYTITEFCSETAYEFHSINGRKDEAYSFTYSEDETILLTCVNTCVEWSVRMTKTDAADEEKYLQGAVFGIYSPDETEKVDFIDEDWGISIPETVEENGQIWYLKAINITDSNGWLQWEFLYADKYLLVELEAPDGYNRSEENRILYRRNAENGILQLQVTNERGTLFPATGGKGIVVVIMAGLILALLSCLTNRRRR